MRVFLKVILLVGLILSSLFFLPRTVAALTLPTPAGQLKDLNKNESLGLESKIETSAATVIKTALALVGTIFFILVFYAGYLWMTAAGNSERVDKAREIIVTAVIGLGIIMAAYAITYFISSSVGGGDISASK